MYKDDSFTHYSPIVTPRTLPSVGRSTKGDTHHNIMTFSIPNGTVVHPIAIRRTDDNGTDYLTDYWVELLPSRRTVDRLSILEVNVQPHVGYELIDKQQDCQEKLVRSTN